MPRARDPRREKAKEIWLGSGKKKKLCDIAKELDLPEVTVRAWKTKDNWENKLKKNEGNVPKEEAEQNEPQKSVPDGKPKKRKGAPFGNKYGKGSGIGNLQAVKHGAFVKIYDGILSEEEQAFMEQFYNQGELDRLRTIYARHALTEMRLMGYIKKLENGEDFSIQRIVKTTEGPDQTIVKNIKVAEEQEAKERQIRSFTDALTQVRSEMRRTADSIRQMTESQLRISAVETKNDESGTLAEIVLNAYKQRKGDDSD